jgi:hypothetical protein
VFVGAFVYVCAQHLGGLRVLGVRETGPVLAVCALYPRMMTLLDASPVVQLFD